MTLIRCLTHETVHYGNPVSGKVGCVDWGKAPLGCELSDDIEIVSDSSEVTCRGCRRYLNRPSGPW